jgi:DNA-directed RNA polymerase subunit RPC12/RpoP
MTISVKCPSCGRQGKAPDTSRGKNARCPACKHTFRVPSEDNQPIDSKILHELWLYKELGEEIGPVTFEILLMLSKKGDLGPESLVKKYPDGEWILAGRVEGLRWRPET